MIGWKQLLCVATALLPVTGQAGGAEPGGGIGVVFMHGRGGQPDGGSIVSLIDSMKSYGVIVVAPTMPWSGRRGIADYRGTMEDAMEIVKKQVARLRASGMRRIVVGGMSAGGNSALAYGAHVGGVDGIMAIAPGGAVDVTTVRVEDMAPRDRRRIERLPRQRRDYVRALRQANYDELAKARRLIAAGRGNETTKFTIGNTGNRGRYSYEIRTTADIFFSYNDPKGMRAMSLSAARLPRMPLLWINDNQGIVRRLGRRYGFDRAPHHPKSRYVELDVKHLRAPHAARAHVKSWLLSLLE